MGSYGKSFCGLIILPICEKFSGGDDCRRSAKKILLESNKDCKLMENIFFQSLWVLIVNYNRKKFPHNVRNFATRMKHFRKIVIVAHLIATGLP